MLSLEGGHERDDGRNPYVGYDDPRSPPFVLIGEADLGHGHGRWHRRRSDGTTWDLFGRGSAGPLEGNRLYPVVAIESFWFDWAAFFVGSEIEGEPG